MKRCRSIAGLTVAVCGLAVGCGGDALSAEEYREQAADLCEQSTDAALELEQPMSPEELGPYFDELVDLSAEQQVDFEELEPPSELEDAHSDALDLADDQQEQLEELAEAVEESDDPAATLAEEIPALNESIERSNEVVEDLGVPECEADAIPDPGQPPS